MNKIYNIILISTILLLINCTSEPKDPTAVSNGFIVTKDQAVISPILLNPNDESLKFAEFNWTASNNGPNSISIYKLVVFDKINDPNLKNPIEYEGAGVLSLERKATITNKEINNLINQLPTFVCGEMSIDIRIKSILGANLEIAATQYSNPINVKVTGYNIRPLEIAFIKNSNVVDASTNKLLSASKNSKDYECYSYLQSGDYKFNVPDDCRGYATPTIIGKGASTGTLIVSGANINIPTTGYYFIKANLILNTYSISPYNTIGINGRGTRAGNGFVNIVPMVDSDKDNIWTTDILLVKGLGIKFPVVQRDNSIPLVEPVFNTLNNPAFILPGSIFGRPVELGATNDGFLNSVTAGSVSETLVPGTFNANQKDKYRVTIDVRNPRKYTYTLVRI